MTEQTHSAEVEQISAEIEQTLDGITGAATPEIAAQIQAVYKELLRLISLGLTSVLLVIPSSGEAVPTAAPQPQEIPVYQSGQVSLDRAQEFNDYQDSLDQALNSPTVR
jgi:hypothetical protein